MRQYIYKLTVNESSGLYEIGEDTANYQFPHKEEDVIEARTISDAVVELKYLLTDVAANDDWDLTYGENNEWALLSVGNSEDGLGLTFRIEEKINEHF